MNHEQEKFANKNLATNHKIACKTRITRQLSKARIYSCVIRTCLIIVYIFLAGGILENRAQPGNQLRKKTT